MDTTRQPKPIIQCSNCGDELNLFPEPNSSNIENMERYLYQGKCHNPQCSQNVIFACLCCFDCSRPQMHLERTAGIFHSWKLARRHGTTKSHLNNLKKIKEIQNSCSTQLENDTSMEYTSSPLYEEDQSELNLEIDDRTEARAQAEETCPSWIKHINLSGLQQIYSVDDIHNTKTFDEASKSPAYFWFEHQHPGQGVRSLTAQAFGLPLDQVTIEEAKFSLIISSLLVQLSKSQRELFAECMLQAAVSSDKKMSIFKRTRVPTCETDFQHLYLSGKNGIIPNLPHPNPQTTADGTHAYVTLTDLLAHELAKGTEFDHFHFNVNAGIPTHVSNNPTISTTPAAYKLFCDLQADDVADPSFTLHLWMREWRDDFDPNNTKASRNQVWIHTNTICPPSNEESKGKNTFFMATSCKGDDHSEVENHFATELECLSKGKLFYHGGLKRLVKVKLGKIDTCVDRPERTSIFQVGDHNGSYSAYWGHACSVDGYCDSNHLPSCGACRIERVKMQSQDFSASTTRCQNEKCSSWDVMDPSFSSPAPKDYPTAMDMSYNAPKAPLGREVGLQNLPSIHLTTDWLKTAVLFAHHNMKTNPAGTNRNKRFWTKGNLSAYLRSCGATARLVDMVYTAAKNDDTTLIFPAAWRDPAAFYKCHYAPMHMLFLGHHKSNFELISKWLGAYEINATFGKQVNRILRVVQKLRCTKWFPAQPLSTSSWATGPWVSENYMFWARAVKYFYVLPAIHMSRHMSTNAAFKKEVNMVLRFACLSNAMTARVMSREKVVADMDRVVKIYLDTMVEMDRWYLKLNDGTDDAENTSNPPQNAANVGRAKRKKQPNFVKANSLGLLSAATMHTSHGPAILHWEGGVAGEQKIQGVKPLLGIKRSNADWQTITLRRLYQHETITWLLDTTRSQNSKQSSNREMEGVLKVFPNMGAATKCVNEHMPFVSVLSEHNTLWIPYRPKGEEGATRSSVCLRQINMDDENGETVCGICWFAPLSMGETTQMFPSLLELKVFAKQFVLMLPQQSRNGDFMNSYYCVGHCWSERTPSGEFRFPDLVLDLFQEWEVSDACLDVATQEEHNGSVTMATI